MAQEQAGKTDSSGAQSESVSPTPPRQKTKTVRFVGLKVRDYTVPARLYRCPEGHEWARVAINDSKLPESEECMNLGCTYEVPIPDA